MCNFSPCTAPLDSPQNIMSETISSTSIRLSWERPLTPNGIITHYSLMYNSLLSDPTSIVNDTMFTVNNLNTYTEYEFRIAAATSAGLGPDAVTSSRTAEYGTYLCV